MNKRERKEDSAGPLGENETAERVTACAAEFALFSRLRMSSLPRHYLSGVVVSQAGGKDGLFPGRRRSSVVYHTNDGRGAWLGLPVQ